MLRRTSRKRRRGGESLSPACARPDSARCLPAEAIRSISRTLAARSTRLPTSSQSTVKTHQTARGAFARALLDHSSSHYIDKDKGGVSNKMIGLAANEIAGRKQREFDESWKMVCAWMRERGVEIEA